MEPEQPIIDVETPHGFRVVCPLETWHVIATVKHPPMFGRERDVARALENPDEVRRSQRDASVLRFHRKAGWRWICAVVLRAVPSGRLITAYPADKIKSGDVLWTR